MFSKGLLVFGLLAIFACQVSNAQSIRTLEQFEPHIARSAIGDLVDQIREIIQGLEALLGGVIADALATLGNLASVIEEIRQRFLQDGIDLIVGIIGDVAEYIRNRTVEAAELGIDIAVCIHGREEQMQNLQIGLAANLTNCILDAGDSVLNTINNKIAIMDQIVRNITRLPVDLSKCLISLRPISCLTELLANTTEMLLNLPGQIADMVSNALGLVADLPINMGVCLANIGDSARNQTQQIIQEIGDCVDDAIAGATTTGAPTTEGPTTEDPSTAAPSSDAPSSTSSDAPSSTSSDAPSSTVAL